MNKFIEVHLKGEPTLINLYHIQNIMGNKLFIDENKWFTADETYEQLKELIWR